jgi:diaminopimelate decarboxylase
VEVEVSSMTFFEILPSLRHAVTPRIDRAIWPLTTHVDELGRLSVGEMALTEVADEFGTPTYVIDEAAFRHRIRRYRAALPEARLVYSGKALLTTLVAQRVVEEGRGLGVCSRGELATALIAGVDPNQIVMHGMAATPDELIKAANAGVGRVVVESRTQVAFWPPVCANVKPSRSASHQTSIATPTRSRGHWISRNFTWSVCSVISVRI